MSCDYSDAVGYPAKSTRVYKSRESRHRSATNWKHRMRKPLWYRALRARGSLR